ncbi:MAG: hypothetical protein K0R24_2021 [Gammaproteobacteria bacterium]|jgi:hypothetical protein|nr:hypothetical protein [Gammaproteobacteria bacterium]
MIEPVKNRRFTMTEADEKLNAGQRQIRKHREQPRDLLQLKFYQQKFLFIIFNKTGILILVCHYKDPLLWSCNYYDIKKRKCWMINAVDIYLES